jgi:glycerol-3-phosphate dehydrogenase
MAHWQDVARTIDPDLLARLLARYGAGTFDILRLLDRQPTLAAPLCPHHETIEAEIVHAFQQESACTLTDVLARRTRVAWSRCRGLEALPRLSALCAATPDAGGASPEQHLAQYHQFLAAATSFRAAPVAAA